MTHMQRKRFLAYINHCMAFDKTILHSHRPIKWENPPDKSLAEANTKTLTNRLTDRTGKKYGCLSSTCRICWEPIPLRMVGG